MPSDRTEAVERALSILQAFSNDYTRMTLTQLANETGLHKSTVLRLTNSLAIYGFIQRDSAGRFSVGPSVWRLGMLFRRNFLTRETVAPALNALVEATGETASFYVLAEDQRVCLYRQVSPHVVRVHGEEGIRLNLSTGASGRVLYHFSTGGTLPAEGFTAAGSVHSVGETIPDISSIATPVFSKVGELLGALVVSGVRTRFTEEVRNKAIPILERVACSLRE
ncbi:MAG: IclR family transcriptional regulator [Pseudomonadota bacterium]